MKRQNRKILELHTTVDSIAHELNTPLTTLKFALESIENPQVKTLLSRQVKKIEEATSAIHQQNTDNELLIKEFIQNYFDEKQKNLTPVLVSVNSTFKSNKNITTEDFKLILNNLLENSAKYGAKNIDVKIVLDKKTEIIVSDDGIGISANERKQIFEKYYRIPDQKNSEISGLGLGLFLVKNTVGKYGGNISATENLNKGATFKILIPNV